MRFNNAWCYRRILFSKGFVWALWQARRNVVADDQKSQPPAGPYMAELDITYRCNCRCRMCQRWRDSRTESLHLADYQRLARDFKRLGGVHQVSIAGGEPLMRNDVIPIIRAFADLGMSVNLCTSGLLLTKHLPDICRTGATCVTVSLDGATAECHDAVRGIPGAYRQVEKGIQALLMVPRPARPLLRVRMTISGRNQHEIGKFYQKWRSVADDVLLQPVHHCRDAYYTGLAPWDATLDPLAVSEQIGRTPLGKDRYLHRLVDSLANTGRYPDQRCFAGVLMTRIDPWGNVYPCLEQHVRIGSLHQNDFISIWKSEAFARERSRLASDRGCRCWYNNTALIGHYGNLLGGTGYPAVKSAVRRGFSRHQGTDVPVKS